MKKYILIALLALNYGCTKKLLKTAGAIGIDPELQVISSPGRSVYFLGMTHLAEQGFYDKCHVIIDSLSRQGYFIFGEGVQMASVRGQAPTQEDTVVLKKIRKIIGFQLYDYLNNPVLEQIKAKYSLVVQPKSLYADKDSSVMQIIDCTAKELVHFYEQEKGTVELSTCDKDTQLGASYNCAKLSSAQRNFFIEKILIDARNKKIASKIKNTVHKKLLLVYGKKHYPGINSLMLQ